MANEKKVETEGFAPTVNSSENEIKEDWEIAEKLFQDFLNDRNIPFIRHDQNIDTYSKTLKKEKAKRPDYIIFTNYFIYHIDVKYKNNGYYTINKENIIKLFNFQKQFHQEVWIAFNNDLNKKQFLFINISTIFNFFYKINNIMKKEDFHLYPNDYFYIPYKLFFFNEISNLYGFYKNNELIDYDKIAKNMIKNITYHRENKLYTN